MATHDFYAKLEHETGVQTYYIYRSVDQLSGRRIGDVYLCKPLFDDAPPEEILVRIEWTSEAGGHNLRHGAS
jgi:hypothetical protein